MDFSRYNNNLNDLKRDIEAAEENSKKFEEIIPGTYEISIESLAVKETKSGDSLMLSVCMKILDGKYKNRLIFFNQLLMTGFGIHKANEFLRSLDTGADIKFEDFIKYDELVKEVEFTIRKMNLEYELEYSKTEKNGRTYDNYKITQVFEG